MLQSIALYNSGKTKKVKHAATNKFSMIKKFILTFVNYKIHKIKIIK